MDYSAKFEAFGKALQSDLVHIVANPGSGSSKFSVHKHVVCAQSEFFDKAFNGTFKESANKEITLHDVNAHALQAALCWSYNQGVLSYNEEVLGNCTDDDKVNDDIWFLVRLWLVGDRLLMPKMQNAVMKELLRLLALNYIEPDQIFEIYKNTAPGSILRELACEEVAYSTVVQHTAERQPAYYAKCFDELENFGRHVTEATREILTLSVKGNASREVYFRVDIFTVPEQSR